ncbi:MAG: hypothetical protein RR189_00345 [Bacilli bacterium]
MEKKNTLLLTVVAVATLLVAVVGATFAFFTAQKGAGASANVNVKTSTTDSLVYNAGSAISITATQENFKQGAGNRTGVNSSSVVLTANADTAATYCYTSDFIITANDFVYSETNAAKTPELKVDIKKNTTLVLTAKDITEVRASTINVPTVNAGATLKHTITAAKGVTTTDTWETTVTLVNLNLDQQLNTGKAFTGSFKFTTVAC